MKKIKDSPYIRAALRPIMDKKMSKIHSRYLESADSWYLKTLKGIHAGERCFIIGNGPSLCAADLDKLTEQYTFAANRIYNIFKETAWRPKYYLSVDFDVQEELARYKNSDELKQIGHFFFRINPRKWRDESIRSEYPIEKVTRILLDGDFRFEVFKRKIWNHQSSYVSEDVSNHFSDGLTVTFESIQLAIYMGFTEIYLLGVDFNYSVMVDIDGNVHRDETINDYFNGERYNTTMFNYNSMLHSYRIAREYCDNHGIKIYNATRGGKLEVFERVDFDKLFENKANKK